MENERTSQKALINDERFHFALKCDEENLEAKKYIGEI